MSIAIPKLLPHSVVSETAIKTMFSASFGITTSLGLLLHEQKMVNIKSADNSKHKIRFKTLFLLNICKLQFSSLHILAKYLHQTIHKFANQHALKFL